MKWYQCKIKYHSIEYPPLCMYHLSSTPTKHQVKGGQFLGATKHRCPFKTMRSTATASIPNAISSHPSLHHPPPSIQEDPLPKRPFHIRTKTHQRDSHHPHAIMARLIPFRTIVHISIIVLPRPFFACMSTFEINSRTAPTPSHVRFDASMVCHTA